MNHFSSPVIIFQPPEKTSFAGYAALIESFKLRIPLPETLCVIGEKNTGGQSALWRIFSKRYLYEPTISGHLTFALKYEGVDLALLRALFFAINPEIITEWINQSPTGQYSRRIWFLYEWLMGQQLGIPEAQMGNYVDVLDGALQFRGKPIGSRRHRVNNNLPGCVDFCPLVRVTPKLHEYQSLIPQDMLLKSLKSIPKDLLSRASAYLLIKESQSSFAIEGERPPQRKAEIWGREIGQAGQQPLTLENSVRLQKIMMEDVRFIKLGLRKEGGFVGTHDRDTAAPLPDHISARYQDLDQLMKGMFNADVILRTSNQDPILQAAVLAFGFVFIHPFEDGNGRLHRYIMHYVLNNRGFSPKGIVFPISAVILSHIDEYRQVLESYSLPRLDLIQWKSNTRGNIEVLNETIDLYRYFDATRVAEFFYACVFETIKTILPEEIEYLKKYDRLKSYIHDHFEMSDTMADLLIVLLRQNDGVLSKRAREKEFKGLTQTESEELGRVYGEVFGDAKEGALAPTTPSKT